MLANGEPNNLGLIVDANSSYVPRYESTMDPYWSQSVPARETRAGREAE